MAKLALAGGNPVRTAPFPAWPVFDDSERLALNEVLESRQWGTLGPKVTEFERRFAEFVGTEHAQSVANGTVSLEVLLRAMGVGRGDEVLIPPYTFVATVTSVLMVNATPVFVDVDPETNAMDAETIERVVTERTRAIIPVHVAGMPADMDRILQVSRKHNLRVIEDAAQAHGAEWNGRRVGSIGDAGSFSFQLSKNLTAGEGGAITTNDAALFDACWSIHHVGRARGGAWYEHHRLSSNYRMTDWQAAILLAGMDRLPAQMAIREQRASLLSSLLAEIPGIRPFDLPERVTRHAYHLYMFRYDPLEFQGLPKADFVRALSAEGIPASGGYVELHKQPLFSHPEVRRILTRDIDYAQLDLPGTKRACEQTVWLPQYTLLGTNHDMSDIALAIEKIRKHCGEVVHGEHSGAPV